MGSSSVPGLATRRPAATSRSVTEIEVLGLATRIFIEKRLSLQGAAAGARPQAARHRLGPCHDLLAVGQGEAAAGQHNTAIYDDGLDLVARRTVHQDAVD